MKNLVSVLLVLLSGELALGETVKLYKGGVCETYEDILKDDSSRDVIFPADTIVVSGEIDQITLNNLKASTTNGSRSKVQVIDLSGAYFAPSEKLDWESAFSSCKSLTCFRFPEVQIEGECKMDFIFYGNQNLTRVENLDKVNNIVSLCQAFDGAKSIEELTFSENAKILETAYGDSPLYRTFASCEKLKHINNFDKFESFKSLRETFFYCGALEEIAFTENGGTIDDYWGLRSTFKKCSSLKRVRNLDKFVLEGRMDETFADCSSLTEIRLGTVSGFENSTFENCDAIVYLDVTTSQIPKDWVREGNSHIVWPIDKCSILLGVSNENSFVSYTYSPACAVVKNTIYRVGETFDSSVPVKLEEISEKDTKKYLWMGLKNESMDDYFYSDSTPITFRDKEAFAIINGYKVSVDTLQNKSDYYSGDSIKIIGSLDDERMAKVLANIKNKNRYKVIDFSESEFEMDSLNFAICGGNTNLVKFYFPNEPQKTCFSLEYAFYNCDKLKEVVNFDNIVHINNLRETFYNCIDLEEISFSEEPDTNKVALDHTFSSCMNLKKVNNIDRYTKIISLYGTFLSCKSLEEIRLSTVKRDEAVDVTSTFGGCSSLKNLIGFDAIQKYMDNEMYSTFSGCTSLDTLRISADISRYDFERAFDNCPAIKYLPTEVRELLTAQKMPNMSNFVLPIKRVYMQLDSLSILQYPKYCAVQDTVWRCLLETGDTIVVKKLTDEIINRCVAISCGLKNESMEDYCWSNSIYNKSLDIPYLVVENVYLVEKDLYTTFPYILPIEDLHEESLNDAYTLQFHGYFNDSTLSLVKKSLSKNRDLHSCDFSDAELDVTYALNRFFAGKKNLDNVVFPAKENDNPISLSATFYQTGNMPKVDLSYFTNIICMDSTFMECGVDTILFPTVENNNNVSFRLTFFGCNAESYDLSSFSKISSLIGTFSFTGISYLKFSDKANNLPVNMQSTFGLTSFCLPVLDLSSFTNVTSFLGTFQMCGDLVGCGDGGLDTLIFGTDPNTLTDDNLTWTFLSASKVGVKYVPDGVDSLPKKWRSYRGFVLPLGVDSTYWTAYSLFEDIFSLPAITPSYAYVSDTTRYLVLKSMLKSWMAVFGFPTDMLRSDDGALEYIVFDPETMNLEDYKDSDYVLTCVVSNPKFNTLAYALGVDDILNSTPASLLDEMAYCNIDVVVETGGFSISTEDKCDVDVLNTLGVSVFKGVINSKAQFVSLPSGIYMILYNGMFLKKVIVK